MDKKSCDFPGCIIDHKFPPVGGLPRKIPVEIEDVEVEDCERGKVVVRIVYKLLEKNNEA